MHRINLKLNRLSKGLIQVIPVVVPDVGSILSGDGSMTAYFPNGETTPPLIWEQVGGEPVTFTSTLDEPTITFTSNSLGTKIFKCTTNPTDPVAATSDTGIFVSYPLDTEEVEPIVPVDSVYLTSESVDLKYTAGVGNHLPGTDNISIKELPNNYTSVKINTDATLLKAQLLYVEGGAYQVLKERIADPYLDPYFTIDGIDHNLPTSEFVFRVTYVINGHVITTDLPLGSAYENIVGTQIGYKDSIVISPDSQLDSTTTEYKIELQSLAKKYADDSITIEPEITLDSVNLSYNVHLQSLLQYEDPSKNDTINIQPTSIIDSVEIAYSYTLGNYIGVT